MATDTLCTSLLDWDPIAGFLPPVVQEEPKETSLVPECVDALMAEWNPRIAQQLGGFEPKPSRVQPLQDTYHSHLGFTKLPSVHGYDCKVGER